MKAHRFVLLSLGLASLLLTGCVTRYDVHLDALNTGGGQANGTLTTYRLASDTPGVEETDLFFKEVSRQLRPALAQAGFRLAADPAAADLQIDVKAVLSDPLVETRSYSEPIYFDSPGYIQTVRVPIVGKDGKVIRYAYSRYWSGPRTRFAGYVDRDRQLTVYDKILQLSAQRLDSSGAPVEEVWAITIRLRSESTDYRSALPYMLAAAQPYIGSRTEGEIKVGIREDSPELSAYRDATSSGDGG
jgi:hypothetical protein